MTVINPKSISGITSITTPSGADDLLTIHNNSGAERLRIDGSGNTRITSGIVTTVSVGAVTSVGAISGDISIADKIVHTGDTNTAIRFPSVDTVTVETNGIERSRIDSAGRLLVGATASEAMFYTGRLQVQGTNSGSSAIAVKSNQNDSGGPAIVLGKSRGTSAGAVTVVQSGDELGSIYWNGADGTDTNSYAAAIRGQVDGSPGSNDMPGRLILMTTADGASSATERMRINSVGKVGINSTSPDGMLAIEHTSSSPNLTMRNHPAAGVYTNNYGMELRHAFGSVQHGCLIHTQEADLGRRALDVSDSGGVFATFVNGKVGIKSDRPAVELNVTGQIRAQASGDSSSYVNIKNNQIYMDANGTGYLDIGHVGGGLQVRTSASSSLDTTGPMFKSDGNLAFASGKGIDFSATSDAGGKEKEILDDYEEGQWTPTIQFSSGGNTATYGSNTGGWYTKVGRLVTCNARIQITAKGGGSSAVQFGGLPFTVGNNNSGTSGIEGGLTFAYAGNCNADKGSGWIGGYANESSTYAVPFYVDTSNNFHYVEDFDIDSDFSVGFTITYAV
tara:strand:+ start:36 stop:1721 length:1686 start_codon:yes stop_codon:yes gene_type:complete